MPRPLRINIPNLIFHVLNRGNNRQTVFVETEDYQYYLEIIKKYKEKFGIKIYHYCLMPNHEHFLLEPTQEGALSKFMQGVTQVHTDYSHKGHGSVGHVWQSRYKSSLVEKGDYKIQCAYYIEDNPRRAKLVERIEDWPWSSYHFYAYGKLDPIVDVDLDYLNLGSTSEERQRNYREFFKKIEDQGTLQTIREKLHQGVLGSTDFSETAKKKFGLKLIGRKGRPQKSQKRA